MKRLLAAFAIAAAAFVPSATYVVSGFSRMTLAEAQLQEDAAHPRNRAPVTFLQINDVYSTVPIDGLGGLARVATLKQLLARAGRTPFVVLAGDFLSPSVASSVFKGEQMVAALNAAGLDLATLGNHEFDFGDDVLLQRMREAKWQWVISNVIDTRTERPIGGAAPYFVTTFGPLKVGFIGLVLTTAEIARERLTHTRLVDPFAAAAKYVPALKARGASIIVAVTHLAFDDDRRLAQRFPDIDLVIGGHEHFPITATENGTLISKAGSEARWVARIDVNRRTALNAERFYELIPITSAFAEEPRTAAIVASYETRLGAELDTVIAVSRVPLEAETLRLRASETNLGDLFADALRAETGADVALLNSGGIRGDRVYEAGPLTRRTLLAMHPFGNVVCKISVSGRVLLQALNSGVSKLPAAAGQFPQVSGLTMTVDRNAPPSDRVHDAKVNGQRLDADKMYTLALPDFVLKGGDNYTMFAGQRVLIAPESGDLLVTAFEKFVKQRQEITQETDGRITIR
jgi:2',3'-cyclic-nucleotide 2'-phosphodiesterase (5'-nucleotidase family)